MDRHSQHFTSDTNKMKKKAYHNYKIKDQHRNWGNINISNTQMHARSLFCLGTGTSIKV
jgi:hypothetical protein